MNTLKFLMSWRWYKRVRVFRGANINLNSNGAGWSWGVGFVRFGVSPNGRKWFSVGIPGTSLRYFKYISPSSLNNSDSNDTDTELGGSIDSNSNVPTKIKKWDNLK